MYEPSDDAKYFHSVLKFAEAVALTTSFCLIAASTTTCSALSLVASADIVVGSVLHLACASTPDSAGTGASRTSVFLAIALARATSIASARDPPDLVFGHDRAAREAPDAAVNHAHAEAGRARRAVGHVGRPICAAAAPASRRRRRAPPPPPRPPPPPPPRPPPRHRPLAAAAAASFVGETLTPGRPEVAREADVRVRAAGASCTRRARCPPGP